jgi:hypothetical protein
MPPTTGSTLSEATGLPFREAVDSFATEVTRRLADVVARTAGKAATTRPVRRPK